MNKNLTIFLIIGIIVGTAVTLFLLLKKEKSNETQDLTEEPEVIPKKNKQNIELKSMPIKMVKIDRSNLIGLMSKLEPKSSADGFFYN